MHPDADAVLAWYAAVRRDLPWRRTDDPYRILVSEVMLQQTQVARVVPYYEAFVERFPTAAALAAADPGEVSALIRPVGFYNRKAPAVVKIAQELIGRFGGDVPRDLDLMCTLPSVG
ncbi:MAG: A/G-specific adenine glycosylase, partial [Conexibacter sp.]